MRVVLTAIIPWDYASQGSSQRKQYKERSEKEEEVMEFEAIYLSEKVRCLLKRRRSGASSSAVIAMTNQRSSVSWNEMVVRITSIRNYVGGWLLLQSVNAICFGLLTVYRAALVLSKSWLVKGLVMKIDDGENMEHGELLRMMEI
ncbi:hypothetical protein RYX36_009447 [Vicia faba]